MSRINQATQSARFQFRPYVGLRIRAALPGGSGWSTNYGGGPVTNDPVTAKTRMGGGHAVYGRASRKASQGKMGRALTLFVSGRTFALLMAGATLGPLALILVHRATEGLPQTCAGTVIQLLTLIAAPHVLATACLLFDRRDLAGITRPGLTIYAIPAALMAGNYVILLAAPLWAVTVYMLVYVHFSMWHFGRQNLGVMAFAARIGKGRAMDAFERRTVMAGVVAGVLGGYHMFAPTLMLDPAGWPLDLARFDPIFSRLWYGGAAIFAALIPATAIHILRNRTRYDGLSLALYLGCVFFFMPAYVSDHPLFLLVSWSTAHGVQYLIFVAYHAAGKAHGRLGLAALAPLAVFIACLVGGVALWRLTGSVRDTGNADMIRILVATTTALTLAHYWIDAFLWKFGSAERRAWLVRTYQFLALQSQAAKAAAGD